MDLGLQGKVAVVCGASRGLGAATARELAREGATVVLAARRRQALVELASEIWKETGATTMVQPTDLTSDEEVARLVDQAGARFGRIDVLITNCGGPATGPFEKHDLETWQRGVDVVLLSVVRVIRAALPCLRKSETPSILTFSSNSARQPVPNMVLANSLRLAVLGLTKTLAQELGPEGIRVNSITPAWTLTERVTEILTERAGRKGTTFEQEATHQAEEGAFNRLGTPEEFARAAVFLCSPAVPFLTGVMMPFDGGIYKATL